MPKLKIIEEFDKTHNYLERMRQRYYKLINVFVIYEQIKKLLAPNVVGRKVAISNKKTADEFNYLFNAIIDASMAYLLIELYKFFDSNKKALSFSNLLKFMDKNINKIQKKHFLEYHKNKGRDILNDSFKRYKSINKKTINSIKKKINREKKFIDSLRRYRNQSVAHDDFNKEKIILIVKDIRRALKLIKTIMDILNKKIDNAMYIDDNFQKYPKEQIEFLFLQLKKTNK